MLVIPQKLIESMVAHARKEHPIEACGIIAGAEGSNTPARFIPMRNAAHATDFFQFDSRQQLQVWKDMDARGEQPIVIYHSHTSSVAYPSREDIEHATEPQAHYVIISTDHSLHSEAVRSFRIVNGMVTEERIRQVAAPELRTSLEMCLVPA